MPLTDGDIANVAEARQKALPNEPFPVLMDAVFRFLNIQDQDARDIATGSVLSRMNNMGVE